MAQYIFCINPGRSGSHYLCKVMKTLEGVSAHHEPAPIMNGEPMAQFLAGNRAPLEALMPAKYEDIQARKAEKEVYIETNHCFIKGFGWLLPRYIDPAQVGVIILKREPEAVARSLYKINVTPFSQAGRDWIITPNVAEPTTPFPPEISALKNTLYPILSRTLMHRRIVQLFSSARLDKASFLKRYDLLWNLWYVKETYALGQLFLMRYPQVQVYEVSLEDLNYKQNVRKMLDHFGIQAPIGEKAERLIGTKTNLKQSYIR